MTAGMKLVPRLRISLFEHLQEVDLIGETLAELDDDEITQEMRDELGARFVEAITGTKEKIDRTAGVHAAFEAAEAAVEVEMKRLASRKKYLVRNRERLEVYVVAALTDSGLKRVDGFTSALSWKMNPERLNIAEGTYLGPSWMRQPKVPEPEPDKEAIKRALKAGIQMEGCSLTQSLRMVRS